MMKPLIAAGLSGALVACVTADLPGRLPETFDWVAYRNSLRAYEPAELERRYLAAVAEHESAPSSATAISLALLVTDSRNPYRDTDRALSLLDGVALSPGSAPADVEFARFMHGVVTELAALEAALETESATRRSLREQLDALIALEERLNAEGAGDP